MKENLHLSNFVYLAVAVPPYNYQPCFPPNYSPTGGGDYCAAPRTLHTCGVSLSIYKTESQLFPKKKRNTN